MMKLILHITYHKLIDKFQISINLFEIFYQPMLRSWKEIILGSGTDPLDLAQRTMLIISNEETEYIMKIMKSLQELVYW